MSRKGFANAEPSWSLVPSPSTFRREDGGPSLDPVELLRSRRRKWATPGMLGGGSGFVPGEEAPKEAGGARRCVGVTLGDTGEADVRDPDIRGGGNGERE